MIIVCKADFYKSLFNLYKLVSMMRKKVCYSPGIFSCTDNDEKKGKKVHYPIF